ncbi:helix-turn-helix domain-containing protein [Cocleimonas sp. KMM 6892]|uniref:MerR family transcriptional regulator n=1 Tax=unclassified Cocleimonas TaxID=2639732 RepID=UPI002DBD8E18|nr:MULTISPECIES: helix-turn-helix domain-containing protein [unclassified Cocleimonas]MEB8433207.1 helix-turn-helix domain-containing protein [Cocleimonas sp. KMM 6892]MEC4715812.1 helix-turn-helix domain-containing protein [Cocleimonas sp. KMM 6895]MEC4745273.1 helix-turn-helix domain-containing protein [Cocleimonas sp. KMM 6896]
MFSIGTLSKKTGVKVPTIRYYEQIGLIDPAVRTEGNQRRYSESELERLGFIRHARDLGFSIEAIGTLIELNQHPDKICAEANSIARKQLTDTQAKIASLQRLETELLRITNHCQGDGQIGHCYVLSSLSDHGKCVSEHSQ